MVIALEKRLYEPRHQKTRKTYPSSTRQINDYMNNISTRCAPEENDSTMTQYAKSLNEFALELGSILLGSSGKKRTSWFKRKKEAYDLIDNLALYVGECGRGIDKIQFDSKIQDMIKLIEISSKGKYVRQTYGKWIDDFREESQSRLEKIKEMNSYKRSPGMENLYNWYPRDIGEPEVQTNDSRRIRKMRKNLICQSDIRPEKKPGLIERIGNSIKNTLYQLDLMPLKYMPS
jgi:hypothetical protein